MTLARKYAVCCSDCMAFTEWVGSSKDARQTAIRAGWKRIKPGAGLERIDLCPRCFRWRKDNGQLVGHEVRPYSWGGI